MVFKYLLLIIFFYSAQLNSQENKSFVLLELFTSQGCSSCPPADELLIELTNKKSTQGEVYALSFHVDYWNYLGWKDPFSHSKFSKRQREYSEDIGCNIYTPQIIINGNKDVVGSKRGEVLKKLKGSFIFSQRDLKIDLVLIEDKNELEIIFNSETLQPNEKFHVAIVESDISTQVRRGENHGKKLKHNNVVRIFKSTTEKELSLQLTKTLNHNKTQVIAFIQNQKTNEILAITKKKLIQYQK